MADNIEAAAAELISSELDKGDDAAAASTVADFAPWHGGAGTVNSLNYGPGTAPMGGGESGLHAGTGTRPMPASFNVPADNAANLSRIRAEVAASQAVTSESLRRYAKGYVESPGHVAGLSESNKGRK